MICFSPQFVSFAFFLALFQKKHGDYLKNEMALDRVLYCSICEKLVEDESHGIWCQGIDPGKKCPFCDEMFKDSYALRRHAVACEKDED